MFKPFGLAVYVSAFKQQLPFLEKLKGQHVPIFTSLHIAEEVTDTYVNEVEEMCQWLHKNEFYIMADVSPYTLEHFGEESLSSLVKRLHIDNVRLDFGFDKKSLGDLFKEVDVTYNASTILGDEDRVPEAYYMHNFYPRPETGLDSELFEELNREIRAVKGKILAFISGDKMKRGPIFDGLPTLESHRYAAPYAQFVDLIHRYQVDAAYVGDISLSHQQLKWILAYLEEPIVKLPVILAEAYHYLYDKKLTVRVDSPKGFIRVQESREFAQEGEKVEPADAILRRRGTVTIDNLHYKRYSGEIQVMKADYPDDTRVNVIGHMPEEYLLLLENIKNGEQFSFVPINENLQG
ncbi:MupG family TIM beta-alpha barrel fold protein [Alkalibacterium iburiense]|uniref:MupG family TIM beta-alpha barrel fold protein n=1 Tax=Alkalibacterium iburiense TaxID=290589 RepID=A0ABN0XSA1_9LACT